MNKLVRYVRRVIFWFETPLPKDEWMSAYRLGKIAGHKEAMWERGPVQWVQPVQEKQQTVTVLSRSIREIAQQRQKREKLFADITDFETANALPVVEKERTFLL